jgi:CheY-like chemotaxis protein
MREKPLLLLVDDDKDFAEIMTAQLRAAGFDVEVARTQGEAYVMAPKVLPDLVLMDIYLSSTVRGTDVAFALKQDPRTQNLRIAFLSSMKDPWPGIVGEKRDISHDLGMEDFIDKTEDMNVIIEKIRTVLSRGASSPSSPSSAIPVSAPAMVADTGPPSPPPQSK